MIVNRVYQKYLKWQFFIPEGFKCASGIHIDLGSGNQIRNPLNYANKFGADYKLPSKQDANSEFFIFDLTKDFPFKNDSIASFSAFDVIEHIPRWERDPNDGMRFPFLHFMNEVNRCLIPGGVFLAVTPAYPSPAAFQDPTHVNIITEETIKYFEKLGHARNLDYEYSGDFKIVHQSWVYSNCVYSSYLQRPNKKALYFARLILFMLKIYVNIYVRKNNPTHLLWILQKI